MRTDDLTPDQLARVLARAVRDADWLAAMAARCGAVGIPDADPLVVAARAAYAAAAELVTAVRRALDRAEFRRDCPTKRTEQMLRRQRQGARRQTRGPDPAGGGATAGPAT